MRATILLVASVILADAGPSAAQTATAPVQKPGAGVTMPIVLREVKPSYTAEAIRARIEGSVHLECVVNADGTVGDVRVLKPLDPSLDAEAIKALKQWRFKPGARDGKAVPVQVEVELTFTLRSGPRLGSPDVYKPGPGVKLPAVVSETKPAYPPEAKAARIEGSVGLDCVVLPNGLVGDVQVTRSLDPALDAEAVRALRQWRFDPGTVDGRAVPVQVTVEMTFSLR